MKSTIESFYTLLFGSEDGTCFTDNPYGTDILPMYRRRATEYFSINPMHTSRKDTNVTCYRNILLEFDKLSLTEQLVLIATIPRSTVVFSGKKSYHCIISLERPCQDRIEYDALVRRIMKKIPQADPSTKNPSRLSRCPGVLRKDTNQLQDLIGVYKPVTKTELEDWLGPELISEQPKSVIDKLPEGMQKLRKGSTSYFLEFGATEGHWNRELFLTALDLLRCGTDEEQVRGLLAEVTGRLDKSDLRTIQSAVDTWRKDG